MDIVLAEKMNIVVRVGGFDMFLRYLSSICYSMHGSGSEDLLGLLYGKNMIENIPQGKDYERAV